MINRDWLYYSTRELADTLKFSANAYNTHYTHGLSGVITEGTPLIAWTTVVLIGDTHEMWVRGKIWALNAQTFDSIRHSDGRSLAEIIEVLEDKQDRLQSGVNIKSINGQSILGEGDIQLQTRVANRFSIDFNDGCLYVEE